MNFFETRMGNKFFTCDVPKLIKAVERVADALEKAESDKILQNEIYHRNKLFSKLLEFAKTEDFSSEVLQDQFHALWVAFCIHADYAVDTSAYDNDLLELWREIAENATNPFVGFDAFDNFMCKDLV